MTTLDNDFKQNLSNIFCCELCDFSTSRKNNYNIHLLSKKHKNNEMTTIDNDFKQNLSKKYSCKNCPKAFNDRAGLWRHNKKCKLETIEENNYTHNDILSPDFTPQLIKLITELVKGQNGIQESIVELCKNGMHNTTHTNSHNKTFNLNMFLNETCKDAMNINDFVDSIKLQLSDLEKVGELGYIDGISSIIVKNLNAMDVTLRPVHCTDKKRETMYIKDEDKWEKEDANKVKLHKMVRKVANKNIHLIQDFKEKYPDCIKSSSRHSDKYNKIIVESMGGTGDNEHEKEEKIIKKIAKEVFIEKVL